ncbi:MAG: signal peptidase I [Planctomycetes bacterium]|nr:signal peptidase I [Planctomycetota bacterium]
MWVIEKYIKYLCGFFLLWGIIYAIRTYSCTRVESEQMMPLIPKDSYIYFLEKERLPNQNMEVRRTILHYEYLSDSALNPRQRFVGRLIALPGERVSMEKGKLKINGQIVGEDYIRESGRASEDVPEIMVPRDHYFILGDYRGEVGFDSRSLGPISVHSVRGKAAPLFNPR